MAVNGRRKGHQFERVIAQKFKKAGWKDAKRHLEYQIQEAGGVDLDETSPYLVQCKRGRKYAPIEKINEIGETNGVRLLVTKGDHKEIMAVLPFEDFLAMAKKLKELENASTINEL